MSEPVSRPETLEMTRLFGVRVSRSVRTVLATSLGVATFTLLTFVGASIRIPLQPVPVTLQTLFVILAGAILGTRGGALSQSTYLLMGIAGLPLFAGTAVGLAVLTGPTGGYLVGFVLSPLVIGHLINKNNSFLWHVAVFSLGAGGILLLGMLHLAFFYTGDLWTAVKLGLLPFLLGDTLKIFAAASIYRSYSHFRRLPRTR